MIRRLVSRARDIIDESRRILRVVRAPRSIVVGYTKNHPIYTDVFERCPPNGFIFYRCGASNLGSVVDRWMRRRLNLLHLDAASPRPEEIKVPIVVECEGRPRPDFFRDPLIRHVFVESRWAGGDYLTDGRVTLLRPSVPIPERRARRSNGSRDVVLLAVGHGGMVKGLDVVVRVYEALKKDYSIRLIIAGSLGHNAVLYPEISEEAYAEADFESLARRLASDERATLRPFPRRTLQKAVYPSADIYLHLSRLETFGYSILEAMSHELPVVATRLHAIPEIVEHGRTGWLVDPGSADICSHEWFTRMVDGAIAAIRRLLEDPLSRIKMGEAGRQRVERVFDIEFKRREVARVYTSALRENAVTSSAIPSVVSTARDASRIPESDPQIRSLKKTAKGRYW